MLKLLNDLTLNVAKPYVKFTSEIIFHPSETALKIKRSQHLDVSPYIYVKQAIALIIGIWLLGYLVTMKITTAPSLVFNIILAIYFITNIILFSSLLWAINYRNKSISLIFNAYSCILGAFAPITLCLIEILRICCHYIYPEYDLANLNNIIVLFLSLIGVSYLYKYLKIIQRINLLKFSLAIILFSLISIKFVESFFLYLIDYLKMVKMM